MGYIIKDSQGSPIFMDNASDFHLSVLQSEALALKMAIKKIKELNLSLFEIESDNLCLVNVLNGIWHCPWDINSIVTDLIFDLSVFPMVRFRHIFREANHDAGRMAKLGLPGVRRYWKDDLEL